MADLLLADVEIDGVADAPRRFDVLVTDGRIVSVVPRTAGHEQRARSVGADVVIDGGGGALIPGLWDHHIHLLAMGAATTSLDLGPTSTAGAPELAAALHEAHRLLEPDRWIRGVGYDESVAGDLDRDAIDRLLLAHPEAASRPVRIQHRSGRLWMLNSTAVELLELERLDHPGIERDGDRPTGRLLGADELLDRIPRDDGILDGVGRTLAGYGITGVTDATPVSDMSMWELMVRARARGSLPQAVMVTGAPALAAEMPPAPLLTGPVKIYLADDELPGLDEVLASIAAARAADRTVAFHSVTRASAILALTALDDAGARTGDRIEHGAVLPTELHPWIRRHGLTIVSQPAFVADRGDRYLSTVDVEDLPHLHRWRSLADAGIMVVASSDAPYGPLDPWLAVRTAVDRRTRSGRVLGDEAATTARSVLDTYLTDPNRPGGPRRTIGAGEPADLCLLDRPLDEALELCRSEVVAATIIGGTLAT